MVKKCIRYASNWKRYRSLVDKIVLYLHKYVWNIISVLSEDLPLSLCPTFQIQVFISKAYSDSGSGNSAILADRATDGNK